MSKLDSLKKDNIGQSAAKPRIEERSETISKESRGNPKQEGTIYVLVDSKDSIRYVGQTTQLPYKRFLGHLYDCKRKSNHVQNWINKELKEDRSINIKPIKTYPIHLLTAAEKYWIKYFSATGCKLVNTKLPMPNGKLGIRMSEQAKLKLSAFNKGKTLTAEHKLKVAKAFMKPVIVFNEEVEYQFPSIKEACLTLGLQPSNASKCLHGERTKTKGYSLRYSPTFSEN